MFSESSCLRIIYNYIRYLKLKLNINRLRQYEVRLQHCLNILYNKNNNS